MQKISPFLWFDRHAEEAVAFYCSVFPDARILGTSRYGEGSPGPAGSVMALAFTLMGQNWTALNGGPSYQFSPAISFVINCENQEEIDYYWERLSDGGRIQQCGWLQDRFGVSWQIVPEPLGLWMQDTDPQRSQRVISALLKMEKLDFHQLQAAADGQ